MTWLAWRQHRAHAMILAAVLAPAAVALAVQRYVTATASASPQWIPSGGLNTVAIIDILAMILLPGLLGLFLGAPLVARELDPARAMMEGKPEIEGDFAVAAQIGPMFGEDERW